MYFGSYNCGYGNTKNYSAGYSACAQNFGYASAGTYRNSSIDLLADTVPIHLAPQELTLSAQTVSSAYTKNLYLSNNNSSKEHFIIEPFLTNAVKTEFVNDAKEIEQFCRNAFKLTTGKDLPSNISINLCNEEELKILHEKQGGKWSAGIQGFSLNRGPKKLSEVFVKKDLLDRVMITLGHEIGHVISTTLNDARDEEAKAFAFSIAWMSAIVDNNIGCLTNAINLAPAKNGLHDAGFEFVNDEIKLQKISAFEIFMQIANGVLSIKNRLEQIILN